MRQMRQSSMIPSALASLAIAVVIAGLGSGAQAKKAATVLEASFKDRITAKMTKSLEAATQHLAGRLSLEKHRFSGYELEFGDELKWRLNCQEVEPSRDSIENCVIRQLHALAALCDAGNDMHNKASEQRKVVDAHLKELVSGGNNKELPNLAMKRTKMSGTDIWMHRKTPTSPSDDVDANPAVQASALMALARCAVASGQKDYLLEAENWFAGLQKVYPQNIWNQTLVSFHKSGIIWESLALVLLHVPKESSFHADLSDYVADFEAFLLRAWKETPSTWSFSSARALALRWQADGVKKKQRKMIKSWAKDHIDRFLGTGAGSKKDVKESILARIGGAGYTCGPLQGLTSLAGVVTEAELVQVVLQLMEKDIDQYQVSAEKAESEEAPESPKDAMDKVWREAGLVGAFFRDSDQMKMEKRQSVRVDDTVQCMVALTQALKTLQGIEGVAVDPEKVSAEAQGASVEL